MDFVAAAMILLGFELIEAAMEGKSHAKAQKSDAITVSLNHCVNINTFLPEFAPSRLCVRSFPKSEAIGCLNRKSRRRL
ncbi:MAG: hypothetical protein V4719_23195 [Planctomycetota bacterium]